VTPKFTIGEAISFGWDAAKRNVGFFMIVFIIWLVASGIPSGVQSATKETAPFLSFVFGLAALVVGQVLWIGLTRISLKFADGEKPEIADLWTHYPLFWKFLLTGLLYALVVAAGLLLLIVPGVIWAVRFSQYTFLVVDRGLSPVEALRTSAEITQGSRWALFLLFLVFSVVVFLGALAFGIGLLWAVPTVIVASGFVFRRLMPRAVSGQPAGVLG
jgi:uncharacterized membrane protein